MEAKITYRSSGKDMPSPHELAKKFEHEIKEVIVKKFFVSFKELSILIKDEDGVYWSEEEPGTLCCLVVGARNGHLYLVTAKASKDGEKLDNFKCDTVS